MEHLYVFLGAMALMLIGKWIAEWRAKCAVQKDDFVYMVRPKKESQ